MLSIATDYVKDTGNPEPYLRRIADAGFSHIHWCHQWNTDFIYTASEIDQIAGWLADYGLRLLDLHASCGKEKNWGSLYEYERLTGVELIKNRIAMTSKLSGDVIVLHIPPEPETGTASLYLTQLRKSLDTLAPFAKQHQVKIALENVYDDDFEKIRSLFSDYDPEFLGMCYDSGHGEFDGRNGLAHLETLKQRLLALHLHDYDKSTDTDHKLLFSGKVDWERLAKIIAESSYAKCVSMEVALRRSEFTDERVFLEKAFQTGETFSKILDEKRNGM